MDQEQDAKRAAGRAAAELVESGMRIGLGTGSTFIHVLDRLAERMAEGLEVAGVPTSEATAAYARQLGVPMLSLEEARTLDLAIDGADEVDPRKQLIKGGGGALLREKIVANAAREMIVVVSANKLVPALGTTFAVPVEVVPFGWRQVADAVERSGGRPELRRSAPDTPFVTDNGMWILDCGFGAIEDPTTLARVLQAVPGVVDHGLFIDMAGRVLAGEHDGSVRLIS
ncbi:MAG: ribose-5-phosphate isomerase RpiA [Planctomycetota bacterium]